MRLARFAALSILCVIPAAIRAESQAYFLEDCIEWEANLDLTDTDKGNDAVTGADGSVTVVGTIGMGYPGEYFILRKYDAAGNLLWSRTLDGNGSTIGGQRIAADATGRAYVVGRLASGWFLRVVDPNGSLVWTDTFSGAGQSASDIAVDPSGILAVTGVSGDNWFLQTFNLSGYPGWGASYGVSATYYTDDAPRAIAAIGGRFVVAGYESGCPGCAGKDWVARAYSVSSGAVAWTDRFAGPAGGDDSAEAVVEDTEGNILVSGQESTGSALLSRVRKLSQGGSQIWSKQYARAPSTGIVPYGGGRFVTLDPTIVAADKLIGHSSDGDETWVRATRMPLTSWGGWSTMVAYPSGGFALVGGTENTSYITDLRVLKIRDPLQCISLIPGRDDGDVPIIYPNPAAGDTAKISFVLKDNAESVVVAAFDSGLQPVRTWTFTLVAKWEGGVAIAGLSDLPPGIYLLKINAKLSSGVTRKLSTGRLVIKR